MKCRRCDSSGWVLSEPTEPSSVTEARRCSLCTQGQKSALKTAISALSDSRTFDPPEQVQCKNGKEQIAKMRRMLE